MGYIKNMIKNFGTFHTGERLQVSFPSVNKNNTIEENNSMAAKYGVTFAKGIITKEVYLPLSMFEHFQKNLMQDHPFLKGEGGCMLLPEDEKTYREMCKEEGKDPDDEFSCFSNDRLLNFARNKSVTCLVAVKFGVRTILVDPQGYSYARYVAL